MELIKLVKRELPLLFNNSSRSVKNHLLPVSIVDTEHGQTASDSAASVRFHPTGYQKVVETFERVSTHRSRLVFKLAIVVTVLMTASLSFWYYLEKQSEAFDLRSIENKRIGIRDLPPPRHSTKDAYTNRLLDHLRQSKNDIEESSNRAGIEDSIRSIERWSDAQQELVKRGNSPTQKASK